METSPIPTPECLFPVTRRHTQGSDSIIPSRKVKAINTIRSIFGFFHKPTKKEKRESSTPSTSSFLVETKFTCDTSCSLRSTSASTYTSGSESSMKNCHFRFSNGTRSSDMDMPNAENVSGEDFSKIGNHDDEELQAPRQFYNCDKDADNSDVFLEESYFEDDYFEDFSDDSNLEELFPVFTPIKENNYDAGNCACNKNRAAKTTETVNTHIDNRMQHNPVSYVADLTSPTESLDLQNKVDQVLQIPTTYFTLGLNIVTNHFGNATPTDRNVKGNIKSKLKDNSPVTNLGDNFRKSLVVYAKHDPGSSNTPVRQTYSVSGGYQTPNTPHKRLSQSNSISSKNRRVKSRKSLYKDVVPSSCKSEDFNNSRRNKNIANCLSIVADCVIHVVGINGSYSKVKNAVVDTEITNGSVEWPAFVQDRYPRMYVRENLSELNQETNKSTSPECENIFPMTKNVQKNLWRMHLDKSQNLSGVIPTETYPRLESGNFSKSRFCSTPAILCKTPTPMPKLKPENLFMSPQSLNKLDGLAPKQINVFQESRTQKFLFPPPQPSHLLKPVPELTESSDWSEMNGVLHSSAGIQCDTMDTIISGGGDMESLKTSSSDSSSESAFRSTFSTSSHNQHLHVSINVVDENNNVVQQSPSPHLGGLSNISSPAINRLQPISTSSPLQLIRSNKSIPRFDNELENSISKSQGIIGALGLKLDPVRSDKINQQIVPHTKSNEMKFEKRKSTGSRTARTCLRFEERNANHHNRMIKGKPGEENVILKETAKFIVDLIPSRIKLKPRAYITAIMENLKENYLRIMKEDEEFVGINSIFQLKMAAERRATTSNVLTIKNSVDQFLLSALIQLKDKLISCSDFVFENIPNVLRENADFFALAPELIVFLLGNDHCIVKGPNGFPMPYTASEKEVLKAAVKFLERHRWADPQGACRFRRSLYQLADSGCVLKDVFHLLATDKMDKETLPLPENLRLRMKHKISYCKSHCPSVTPATEKLSDVTMAINPRDIILGSSVTSHDDRMTLFELSRKGNFTAKTPVDIRMVCDEQHYLRVLYFCFHALNGVPYIVDIGMQYVSNGKKRTMFISSLLTHESAPPHEDTHGRNMASGGSRSHGESDINSVNNGGLKCHSSGHPVSKLPEADRLKKVAMVLTPGEHITAVSLLGNSDVHNLEITTNLGRCVRAHGMGDVTGTKWTRIQAPQDAPSCLHALVGEIRTNPLRLCNSEAVWAVTSLEANNLNC